NEAGACVAARNALEAIEARQGQRVASWARTVAHGCTVRFDPKWLAWQDGTVVGLARAIQGEQAWGLLPVLADGLEEAGCDDPAILGHLRGPEPHARGCWVCNLLLKEE